jgi:hypothetical protein
MKILNDLTAKFNALSAKEKTILYAAAAFIVIAVADRVVISPVTQKLGALDKEIADMHASIKRDLHMLSQKDRIALESTKYKSFLAKEGTEEEEFSSLMKEVETLANRSRINLLDMKPGQVKTVESAKQYQVVINLEAPLKKLTEFMYAVETSKQLLKVEKFQISVKSKEEASVKSTMTISRIILLNPE